MIEEDAEVISILDVMDMITEIIDNVVGSTVTEDVVVIIIEVVIFDNVVVTTIEDMAVETVVLNEIAEVITIDFPLVQDSRKILDVRNPLETIDRRLLRDLRISDVRPPPRSDEMRMIEDDQSCDFEIKRRARQTLLRETR